MLSMVLVSVVCSVRVRCPLQNYLLLGDCGCGVTEHRIFMTSYEGAFKINARVRMTDLMENIVDFFQGIGSMITLN